MCKGNAGFCLLCVAHRRNRRDTGVQNSIKDALLRIRSVTDKPVAVGFGISSPDQAAQIARWGADGVIVGSALVKVIEENIGNSPELVCEALSRS